MWLTQRRSKFGERVRSLDHGGVLDEHTFWQIVKTEKERADRSGVPVTVAVFTVKEDRPSSAGISGWNASTLCSALRSTARTTDHVGIAGNNEIGAILWGTRELGAYRFVNRLGDKANNFASDCKLFVYPTVNGSPVDSDVKDSGEDSQPPVDDDTAEIDILSRIADVEQRLSEAQAVETPVVVDEDCCGTDPSFGFGFDDSDLMREPNHLQRMFSEFDGGSGTAVAVPSPPARTTTVDATLANLGLNRQISVSPQTETPPVEGVNITTEPLENLFMYPHPRWKRAVDIAGAILGLLLLSPLLAIVALAVKLTSRGPILFNQRREGHGGKLFTIHKFRTMRVGADAEKALLRAESQQDGPAFKMDNDPRITPLGSFLRTTCLDELPQLWNVLLGDMTLVGPRPLDYRESSRIARWGRRRLHVMPGLTCIWQVHGKSKVTFNEWMRMDIRYAQRVSFREDMKLVLQTLKQVVLRKASQ